MTDETDRSRVFAALIDEMEGLETNDPRFEPAVVRYCLCYAALSQAERDEGYRLADEALGEALEKKPLDELERMHARLSDASRANLMRQIGFKLGVTLSAELFGRRP